MTDSENSGRLALLVADSHTLLAEAVASAAVRGGYGDVRVASSLLDAYRALNSGWRPSVFLFDLSLIHANDFEALEDLASRAPGVPVVVMLREADGEDMDLIIRAFVKGALGLVSKDRGVDSLLRVLEVVRQGQAAIPRSMARAVVDALRFGPTLMQQNAGLSPRQRQVLALVARGMTDRQIAHQLDISAPTVRSHLEAIFEKTRTANRTAAARWASVYFNELDAALPAT
jgi:DNA-binding NarL/FixJ family response regulator